MSDASDLKRALEANDAEERRRAMSAMRRAEGPVSVALLTQALGDSDWRVRKEAVLTALALAPSAAVLKALVNELRPGDNIGARNSAVEALAGYAVHAIPALAAALVDLDADGKKLVVDILAKGARPEALPILRTLLRDDDVNVRGAAIEAVACIGEACAEEAIAILDACLDSPEQFSRLAALSGLNRLSAEVPWERLEPLADDPILRPAVLTAAGRSGAEPAVPIMLAALASERGRTFVEGLESIAMLGDSSTAAHRALRQGMLGVPAHVRESIFALAGDEDAPVEARRSALRVSTFVGDADAARVAVAALADDSLAEQAEATLSELGGVAVDALIAGSQAPAPGQRSACITLLGPLVRLHPDANAAAKRALGDPYPEVVAAALEALGGAGDRGALGDAVRLISAGPVVRQAAQRALVALARHYPADALEVVRRAAPDGAEAEAAAVVIETLAVQLPDRESHIGFLHAALDSPAATTRCAALSALAAIGGANALEPVAFALGDEEPEVRLAAVHALGMITGAGGAPLGVERLLEVAQTATEPTLVAAACRALGAVADPRALPVLGALLEREPFVAVVALETLGGFQSAERNEALAVGLAHADSEVVKSAMRVLASARDARTVERLSACLDHVEWDVRRLAAEVLGALGGDDALNLLRGRLSVEAQELVRDEIVRAITAAETTSGRRRTAPPPSLRGMRRE